MKINLSQNAKYGLVAIGGLLFLWWFRSASANRSGNANEKLKERSVFEVADSVGQDNKVPRSPIEDPGAREALEKSSSNSATTGSGKKSLWEEAEGGASEASPVAAEVSKPSETAPTQSPLPSTEGEVIPVAAEEPKPLPAPVPSRPEPQKVSPEGFKKVRAEPAYVPRPEAEPPKAIASAQSGKSSMADLMDMSASGTTKVSGRDTMSDSAILQEGSSYLGVLEDPIRLVEGESQPCTIVMIGKLSSNTVAAPFKMTCVASLNKDKTRVRIEVKRCVDSRPSSRAVDCHGIVGDIEGWDGLGGKINSPGIWGTIVRTASVLGSQMALSKMTASVTQNGVLMGETQSNRVLQSLSSAFEALGNDLADKIESGGTNIVVTGQSIVRVRITKDSPLW